MVIKKQYGIDFVTCDICNKNLLTLVTHITRYHKLTTLQYKKLYPNSLLLSKIYKQKISIGNTGKILSDSTRQKISLACTGKNMGDLNPAKKPGVGKKISEKKTGMKYNWKNIDKQKTNLGKRQSDVTQLKRSISLKKYYTLHQRTISQTTRDKISKTLKEGYKSGELTPPISEKWAKKSEYLTPCQGIKLLRSHTEKMYAELLDKQSNFGNNFIWFYEAIRLPLHAKNNKHNCTSIPDFVLIFDWNLDRIKQTFRTTELNKEQIYNIFCNSYDRKFEETKGYWNTKHRDFEKWKTIVEQYPEETFEIITHDAVLSMRREG